MAKKMATWFEVRYVGAPYGDGELGEVVSRHRTLDRAQRARQVLQAYPKYYGSNSRIFRVQGDCVRRAE